MSKMLHMVVVCLLLGWAANALAGPRIAREDQIKAAFLYNFANFITWPDDAFSSKDSKFKICILGEDPFGKVLDVTIDNVTAKGYGLSVQRLDDESIDEILTCHMLYIAADGNAKMAEMLPVFKGKPILTVGEEKTFITEQGGMIGFFIVDKRVKLAVNRSAISDAALRADANLLRLSTLCSATGCDE